MKIISSITAASLLFSTLTANLPMEFYPKTIVYDRFKIFEFKGIADKNYFHVLEAEAIFYFNEGGQIIFGKGARDDKIMLAVTSVASCHEFVCKISEDCWLLSNYGCIDMNEVSK